MFCWQALTVIATCDRYLDRHLEGGLA